MIRINDDYIIDCDGLQYILKQGRHKVDKTGKAITDSIGYYGSLERALEGYVDFMTKKRHSEAELSIYAALSICGEERIALQRLLEKHVKGAGK